MYGIWWGHPAESWGRFSYRENIFHILQNRRTGKLIFCTEDERMRGKTEMIASHIFLVDRLSRFLGKILPEA